MQNLLIKMLESKFNIKVYEIKYVDLDNETSTVSKLNGFKGFADFAIKTLREKKEK